MPSFAVKQPDGRYAAFSTIVDNFTAADQSREEARDFWMHEAGDSTAGTKMANADTEARSSVSDSQAPLSRWCGCLRTVLLVHGQEGLTQTLTDFEMADSERKRWFDETVKRAKPEAPHV